MSKKLSEVKLNIHPSEGVMHFHKLHQLETTTEFKIICISILKEEINHNLLSVLCCNPKYLFLSIIPVSLILGLFALFFSTVLAISLLVLTPLSVLFTFVGLWFRKWMVQKCIRRASKKISKFTNGSIVCEFSFKFFSDDNSDGDSLVSFGNYVKVKCKKDEVKEHFKAGRDSIVSQRCTRKSSTFVKNDLSVESTSTDFERDLVEAPLENS